MSTLLTALYSEVLAHPQDDLPRMIFSDALEEEGCEDHAAFIRYQLETARCEHDPDRWQELKELEWKLWPTVRAWYAERLPPPENRMVLDPFLGAILFLPSQIPFGKWSHAHVYRGFVGRVDIKGSDRKRFIKSIRTNHPIEVIIT